MPFVRDTLSRWLIEKGIVEEMARQVPHLYTIGYSGHTVDTFIETLRAHSISMLLDIRRTPLSRKKGFSKTALQHALEAVGIAYRHIPALGSPADLRRDVREAKDYPAFFAAFRAYLHTREDDISQAAGLVIAERVCLMCLEQSPDECHRSAVADAIASSLHGQVIVEHLLPRGSEERADER